MHSALEAGGRRRRSGSLTAGGGGGGGGARNAAPPPPPGLAAGGSVPGGIVLAPVFERFHTFKEFMALQKDTLEPERAVDLYDQYKYDFKVHSARMVFHQNQDLGFVRERFSPEHLSKLAARKTAEAKVEAESFLEALREGEFKDIALEFELNDPKSAPLVLRSEPHLNGRIIAVVDDCSRIKSDTFDGNLTAKPFYGRNINEGNNVLVLKKLPGDVTSEDITETCHDIAGLQRVVVIPSCLLEENQAPLVVQASKNPADCSEEELQQIEQVMSECYIRGRGNNSPLIPLQTAWLEFDTAENCSLAETQLERKPIRDICTCRPMRVQPRSHHVKRIRVCASEPDSRHLQDLKLTQRMITKLDRDFSVYPGVWPPVSDIDEATKPELMCDVDGEEEKAEDKKDEEEGKPETEMGEGPVPTQAPETTVTENRNADLVKSHPFLSLIEAEPSKKKLDLQLLYLRRVHYMDFYSGRICWSARELFETCGLCSARLTLSSDDIIVVDDLAPSYVLQKPEEATFDRRIQHLLHLKFSHYMVPIGDEHPLFADLWSRFCHEKTLQVDPEKFRCGICRKLFKGAEFVHKHLKNKHASEIEPVKQGARVQMMKQAFESDDSKLLLFVVQTNDFLKVFQNTRPPHQMSHQGESYGPARRGRLGARGGPMGSLPSDRPYRDWDAPRTRLEERAAGGNFRKMIRYDDL